MAPSDYIVYSLSEKNRRWKNFKEMAFRIFAPIFYSEAGDKSPLFLSSFQAQKLWSS